MVISKGETTLDIIAIVLSALALLLSVAQWAFKLYQRRVRLDFSVVDYNTLGKNALFFVSVANKTDNPCSITSIQIFNKEWITCELLPVYSRKIHDVMFHSAHFPVNLSPRGGQSFYILFANVQDVALEPERTVAFQIQTNHRTLYKSEILQAKRHYCNCKTWFAERDDNSQTDRNN